MPDLVNQLHDELDAMEVVQESVDKAVEGIRQDAIASKPETLDDLRYLISGMVEALWEDHLDGEDDNLTTDAYMLGVGFGQEKK